MTFSIRSFLIVIAIFAHWLGALVSRSVLAIEIATYFTALLTVLTLPLAIWDTRQEMRAFWTGYFALGIGSVLITTLVPGNLQLGHQLAELISLQGRDLASEESINWNRTIYSSNRVPSLTVVTGATSLRLYEAVYRAIPFFVSLIAGSLGGCITLWFARRKPRLP